MAQFPFGCGCHARNTTVIQRFGLAAILKFIRTVCCLTESIAPVKARWCSMRRALKDHRRHRRAVGDCAHSRPSGPVCSSPATRPGPASRVAGLGPSVPSGDRQLTPVQPSTPMPTFVRRSGKRRKTRHISPPVSPCMSRIILPKAQFSPTDGGLLLLVVTIGFCYSCPSF